jgi:hypothetical protein
VRTSLALSITAALASCSNPDQFCGDSFCTTQKPSAVEKQGHVDFNFYTVRVNGTDFVIFEGNNPNLTYAEDLGPIGKTPRGFKAGRLYKSDDGYSVVLETANPKSDAYVIASVPSTDVRSLDRFVSSLRGK